MHHWLYITLPIIISTSLTIIFYMNLKVVILPLVVLLNRHSLCWPLVLVVVVTSTGCICIIGWLDEHCKPAWYMYIYMRAYHLETELTLVYKCHYMVPYGYQIIEALQCITFLENWKIASIEKMKVKIPK